jgi:ribosomal protein L37AE/L43A
MYKKACPRCTRSSFSSSEAGEWVCPSCGNDLTSLPLYQPKSLRPLSEKIISKKKIIQTYQRHSTNN